jgi:hypothetical protein
VRGSRVGWLAGTEVKEREFEKPLFMLCIRLAERCLWV